MQMVVRVFTLFTSSRAPHTRQRRILAWSHRILLGLCVLCALVCLIRVYPRLRSTPTGIFALPTASSSSAVQKEASGGESGAGGVGASAAHSFAPAMPSLCSPFDANCFANAMASWVGAQLQAAFQPLADDILQNPADILYQTPPADSYQNATILQINTVFIGVIDAALACLLVIGAYNVMVGLHLRLLHSSVTELIPRAILVACAVHFNQTFLGFFIDLENQLSLTAIHAAGLSILTHILAGMLTGHAITGLLLWILVIVLGILVILLLVQMITRIALVGVCLATAPLGLGCLTLPQSMRWGRLWLTVFASAVMVQVLQVVALGLGGAFITAIASTSLVRLDGQLATAFLAIGVLGLVLRIPGMLQNWALHPMMEGFGGGGHGNTWDNGDAQGQGSEAIGGNSVFGSDGGATTGGNLGMEGTIVTEESGTLLLFF